jgi:hypothetical protein
MKISQGNFTLIRNSSTDCGHNNRLPLSFARRSRLPVEAFVLHYLIELQHVTSYFTDGSLLVIIRQYSQDRSHLDISCNYPLSRQRLERTNDLLVVRTAIIVLVARFAISDLLQDLYSGLDMETSVFEDLLQPTQICKIQSGS